MGFINDFFDKVYCVNLDRRTDRWERVQQEFIKYDIEVERFSAVEGSSLPVHPGQRIMQNEMGCLVSHRTLLERMLSEGHDRIMIMEDDIYFTGDPNAAMSVITPYLPEQWDMVYLGGNHVRQPIKWGSIWKCTRTFTTSSYGITAKFAEQIIPKLNGTALQVDVVYADTHLKGNSFCLQPGVIRQHPGFSDIQNGFVDYDHVRW